MNEKDYEQKEKARLDAMYDALYANEPTSDVDYADEPIIANPMKPTQEPEPEPLWIRNQEGKLELHAPPQREWVGLTDEEIFEIWSMPKKHWIELVKVIQAKLKEKNT